MMARAALVWLAIVPLAIANGAARDLLVAPRAGEAAAHVIATLLLCGAILAVAWGTIRWIAPASPRGGVAVGLLWLALTVAFEFLAGRFLFATPWSGLLADYDLTRGRVFVLVLVSTLAAPPWAARARMR